MLEIGKVQPPRQIHATTHVLEGLLLPKSLRPVPSFFPNSNSKGFGAELLSDSLWFSGADPSCAAKRFRGRFHQGSAKVSPRLRKFRDLSGLLGQIRFGVPKGSVEGSLL